MTYNRADLLTRCLDGLVASTRAPDAVYVVNNASEDHTREVLEAHSGLPLHAIHSEENLGGAGGFHLGVRTAYDAGFRMVSVEQGWAAASGQMLQADGVFFRLP